MKHFFYSKHIVTLTSIILIGAFSAQSYAGTAEIKADETAKNAPEGKTITFTKGEVLSLICIVPKAGEDAAAARKAYTKQAFELAGTFGMRAAGSFGVAGVAVGTFSPAAISFFSWPDIAAERRFRDHKSWASIKALRPSGWDELRIHDVVLDSDVALTFRSDKTYTMATAWINADHPDDYDRYLANIVPAVTASGGRFIYQLRQPSFSALDTSVAAPGRVTFVEWDTPEGLASFQTTDGFKNNVYLMQRGVTDFELIILE